MLKNFCLILLTAFLLCGCSRKTGEEIVFSSWGSVTEIAIIKKVIAGFENENPGIKVKFIHIPQNYFQKLHLLFASNTAPDVIFINNLYLPVYQSQLLDLSKFVETDLFYSEAISGMSIENKLYAVPRDVSNLVFYVNLDKISLPIPDIKDFGKLSSENFVLGLAEEIYFALPYLWYFGGGVLDNEGNVIIDSPESKQAVEFYKNLIKSKKAPSKSQIGSSTLAQMFLDEKISLYLSGRWMYPKISEKADFTWTVVPFPSEVPCDVSGWAISKNSDHKDSALKFIKYLSSEKSMEYFTQTGLIVPARIDVSKSLNGSHNEGVFLEVIKTSKKTPVNKDYKKLTDNINSKIFNE